jgi:hypothetical protein
MYIVIMSTGDYSRREEFPVGFTEDKSVAGKTVLALEAIFASVKQAREQWRYPDPISWERFVASRKLAEEAVRALVNIVVREGQSFSVDDDSLAWITEVHALKCIPDEPVDPQPNAIDTQLLDTFEWAVRRHNDLGGSTHEVLKAKAAILRRMRPDEPTEKL